MPARLVRRLEGILFFEDASAFFRLLRRPDREAPLEPVSAIRSHLTRSRCVPELRYSPRSPRPFRSRDPPRAAHCHHPVAWTRASTRGVCRHEDLRYLALRCCRPEAPTKLEKQRPLHDERREAARNWNLRLLSLR